jgi:hypothetical protein
MDPVTKDYTVRLVLDTSFLDRWTAAAWSVNNTIPIIIEIQFTWQYLNGKKLVGDVCSISNC